MELSRGLPETVGMSAQRIQYLKELSQSLVDKGIASALVVLVNATPKPRLFAAVVSDSTSLPNFLVPLLIPSTVIQPYNVNKPERIRW